MQDENIVNTEIKNEINDKGTEYKQIRKDDIIVPSWVPRKMKIETQEDRNLGGSIKESGLINPLTVRPMGNGKYELIAGLRRLTTTNSEYVWASIQKNKSDFDVKVLCIGENFHRKDIDEADRDNLIYSTYRDGIKLGEIKNLYDMSVVTSIPMDTLRRYIKVGEERSKNKNDEVICEASTSALFITRNLKDVPSVRKKILDMETRKVLTQKKVSVMTKRIEACVNKGMSEKMITKMIDMAIPIDQTPVSSTCVPVDNNINSTDNANDANNGDNDKEKNTKNIVAFNMNKFDDISVVMAFSHPDVREYIVSKKIGIKDAAEINKFETVEERKQLVEEKTKIDNWKKKSQETFDKEWNNTVETRKQQVQDIKNNGDTKLKTRFDIDYQHKLDLAKDADNRHDEDFFRRYRSLQDQLNRVVLYYHPKKVKTEKGKEMVNGIVKAMYEILRLVLIETGGIKTGIGTGDNENGFGHHFVDVEAKVTEEG